MKNHILLFIVLFTASIFVVKSQAQFEKGYFIDTLGVKTECLIDNKDWEVTPTEISYKIFEQSERLKMNTSNLQEFEIFGYSKFISKVVQIDKSSSDIAQLSPVKNPIWKTEKLLLKLLVHGKASLYMYSEFNLTRFFYSINDSIIQQLVCKTYQATNENGTKFIGANNNFRQQLYVDVNNPNYKYDLSKLLYEKKELTQYFEQYNAQFETKKVVIKEKAKRDFFKASVLTGVNFSNMFLEDAFHPVNSQNFSSFISPTIGAEIEFILPFSVQNWSILLQPTFNSKISGEVNGIRYTDNSPMLSKFSYVGIDIPLGIRYRYNMKNNFKISATGYLYSGASSWYDMSINVDRFDFVIQLARAIVPGVGIGVDYKNFGLEFKAIANRDFLVRQQTFNTNFNTVSINLKYQFVDLKINR
jgi:hypothetical protein